MKYLFNICGDIPHAKIENINIPLDGRNLIITGRNGSGKTSFLKLLEQKILLHLDKKAYLTDGQIGSINHYEHIINTHHKGSIEYSHAERQLHYLYRDRKNIEDGLTLKFENELDFLALHDELKAIFVYFKAMRIASITETKHTSSIEDEKNRAIQSLKNRDPESFGNKLEQHLVNIKVNQSLALTEDNNQEQANQFQKWFDDFNSHLKFLFEDENAHLVFYRQNYKFKISLGNREFDFQNLSSGYLAIFEILADLLVRSEFFEITPDELQGIVLIDEIDAHLHISLQKKILPFFTKLFPQIQFIVSTHSPFVITSTDNDTVVYDISSGEFFEEDLSRYSYESVIKGLFHVNPISSDTKNSIEILKNLLIDNPSSYVEIRSIIKNLVKLEKNDLLDKSLKNIYLQAINLLADNNQLEDLDV
jgi:predicted ATP-dependent endonuclease of OLD family